MGFLLTIVPRYPCAVDRLSRSTLNISSWLVAKLGLVGYVSAVARLGLVRYVSAQTWLGGVRVSSGHTWLGGVRVSSGQTWLVSMGRRSLGSNLRRIFVRHIHRDLQSPG